MPRGLVFGFNALETWLYGGDPAANLEVGTLFDDLRAKLEQGHFEDLLRRLLIENPHTCQVIMEPSHTAGEERRQAEQKRLVDEAGNWTDAQKQSLQERQARIQAWQESTDSPEALATLPRLDLKDISAEPEDIPTEVAEIAGIPVLKHEVACGGIVYCTLYFDLADRTEEELSAASMLCGLLGELPTKISTAEQLMNRKQLLCGMFQCQVRCFAKENQPDRCERKLCVSFSALESNLSDAIDLVAEIMTQTRFDCENAVLDILRQRKMMLMQQIVMAGHGLAIGRVAAQASMSGVVDEFTNGYQFYSLLPHRETGRSFRTQERGTKMKKRIIVTAAIAACLALCAAVWLQAETVKETPLPSETATVTAPKVTVEELKTEAESAPPTEKEKAETLQQEHPQEAAPEPKPVTTEIPLTPEGQPKPEPVMEATHEPIPEQNTVPSSTREIIESQSSDMVYVEGFGWIESQGPNHVEYAEDMYENGNKIGIMG